jgi:hypothetical protein
MEALRHNEHDDNLVALCFISQVYFANVFLQTYESSPFWHSVMLEANTSKRHTCLAAALIRQLQQQL